MKFSCKNQLNLVHVLISVAIVGMWFYTCRRMTIFGDDLSLQHAAFSVEWLINRYYHWSSRLLIESVWVPLVQVKWLLQTLNFLVLVATPVGFYLLFRQIKLDFKQAICLSAVLPLWTMYSAGWGATIVNYWYTPLACVFALYFLTLNHLKLWQIFLFVVLLLFGVNQELNAIAMLGTLILMLWQYKRTPYIWAALVLVLLSIAFELTAPGNHARFLSEIRTWLPAYAGYSLPYKAYIGIMHTMSFHLFALNVCFAFIASAIVFLKTRKVAFACAAVIVFCGLQFVSSKVIGGMNGIAPFDGAFRAKHGLALLLVIVEFGFLLWCVLRSEITVKAKVLILSGCALAIAVPSSMGFSPTVWASSDRVFLPGDFMLIGFGILIYHHAKITRDDLWKVIYFCLLFGGPRLARLSITAF